MSERKVLNKYFPPDFDPNKIKRIKTGKSSHTVRLMTPFSMRCNRCGEFIYRRKKFNAKKEKVLDEDYLGLDIFRFYIKCPICLSTITFKTDPKNTDYICESGAQRNFEPWRDEKFLGQELLAEIEAEEANNPMRALERRTEESKREMDIIDALDEIKSRNDQLERVDADKILIDKIQTRTQEIQQAEKEEDEYIKSLFYASDGLAVKRILDDVEPVEPVKAVDTIIPKVPKAVKRPNPESIGIVVKKAKVENTFKKAALIVDYGSDSD